MLDDLYRVFCIGDALEREREIYIYIYISINVYRTPTMWFGLVDALPERPSFPPGFVRDCEFMNTSVDCLDPRYDRFLVFSNMSTDHGHCFPTFYPPYGPIYTILL